MGKNNSIDSSLLDKAIIFATEAHKNTERRAKGFPYIVHPMEAMAIAATMTNDQEILAAAALHDVVEDTNITIETIKKEFGDRVADLVAAESDNLDTNYEKSQSWYETKLKGINRIKNCTRDEQIVALCDKLSNLKSMYLDYLNIGDELWNRFHENNPSMHAWRFFELLKAFDKVQDTSAYREFEYLVNRVFRDKYVDFKVETKGNSVKICGVINENNIDFVEKAIVDINGLCFVDFAEVIGIDYASIRRLYSLILKGYRFRIRNVYKKLMNTLSGSGVDLYIPITIKPREINIEDYEESGDGYTAISYFHKNGDTMMKLYAPFIPPEVVEQEMIIAKRLLTLGISVPLPGELITYQGKIGISFERIKGKRSIARAISQEPDNIEEFVKIYADAVKKLHQTRCDKVLFDCFDQAYYRELETAKEHFTEEEYEYVKNFLAKAREEDTCIHGDLHFGNVLITENKDVVFIDNADFCWGHHYFDIAVLYVMSHIISDERCMQLYHISLEKMLEGWKLFVKYYFNVETDEEIEKIEEEIKPFAGVRIMQFANRSKWKDGTMANGVKKLIFGK